MPLGDGDSHSGYIDAHATEECDGGYLAKSILKAERAAIDERRAHTRARKNRDRTACPTSGLAISGGGIRSASIGLGALQALHAYSGIEGIDYLSTVSGGGYIGCSLTAAMQKTNGDFPFTDPTNYADTDSVRHIRDFSNYLIPHGALDVVTALGIIGRGLAANAFIILPILFFFAWLTLLIHPTVASLDEPSFLIWNLADYLPSLGLHSPPLWGLNGFWFTAILAVVNIVFLVFWAFAKSVSVSQFWQGGFAQLRKPGQSAELSGPLVTISKILFFVTITSAWLEMQPFILRIMAGGGTFCATSSLGCIGEALHGWFVKITPWLAPFGAAFAFLSKYLGDIVALTSRDPRWQAWFKKILAMAALWLAAITIPSCLWLLYLRLSFIGLENPGARGLYFGAFLLTALVAAFLNPNATSLYRLYRDRLSKAFLFDPSSREGQEANWDLTPYEPKLHEIDPKLCAYPVINAALNIERSQYANKRGRNADFFVFTPKYTGSDATGYIETEQIEEEETALNIGTALAISAAAISSNMGSQTIKLLTFTLAILNVRLGYWLRNPSYIRGHRPWYGRLFDIRSFLLFKEAFSWITEKSPTVYLTDGGHIENLGIYSLMKRRCRVIIAIDAEADPSMSFEAFLALERYARIDFGAIIDLPWQAIRKRTLEIDKAFEESGGDASAVPCFQGPHCAAGEIQYGPTETGLLFYIKASLTGDEGDYVLDYKRRNRAFPHETTSDQFFGEEQLEAYRALGFHIVKGLFTGEAPIAVKPKGHESERDASSRVLNELRQALLGKTRAP